MFKDSIKDIKTGVHIALILSSTLLFGMALLFVGIKYANAATLKNDPIIKGDYILLGDIFDGVENENYVLGPAPAPGKDMIFNSKTLYKIATALNVDWKPKTSTEQIILRREAVILSQTDISKSIEEKIVEQGVDEDFSIILTSTSQDIVLPAGSDETMEVTAFRFDPQNDSFNTVIVAPSSEKPIKRMNVSGRIERLVMVPVLKNSLNNGDVIGGHDIDYIKIAKNKIGNGVVLNEQSLVNMTPRRSVSGGKPIILNDLEKPKMVDRGDAVTLIFETGPMVLTVKGKSLQAGAMGDMVRVPNSDSNKNLQGIVTADREVTIR